MTLKADVQLLEPGAVVELFELDLSTVPGSSGQVYRFHAGTNELEQPVAFGAAFTSNMIMNANGLVVNAFNNTAGRGDYFNVASGTSEGQFLMAAGLFDAHQALENAGRTEANTALDAARKSMSSVLQVLYRGKNPPAQVTVANAFAPHWLFAVKAPFKASQIQYDHPVSFTNGVGHIAQPEGPVRYVFGVTSLNAKRLWENPYSVLTEGTAYSIASSEYNASTGLTITLGTGYTGTLLATYSTQTGALVNVGEPYEAWPDWRALDAGEIACACDAFIWAHKAFSKAYAATQDPSWYAAQLANAQQTAIAYDINDSRDWIKPSYSKDAFADGGRFKYSNRAEAPVFSSDSLGRVVMYVPAGAGEARYGKASIGDTYAAGDSTTIEIGSSQAQAVTVFIDLTSSYSAANRYSASLALTGSGVQTFTLTRADFKNSVGQALPAGSSVYTFGVSSSIITEHALTIGRVRQLPNRSIAYYPGAIPFTANFLGDPGQLIDWRGPVYMGYQSPLMWKNLGNNTALANCVALLADAQAAWPLASKGPFVPVFYFDRADAVQYGATNTFGWTGPDPNTKWAGYQYRPLADLAEMILASAGTEAYYTQAVSVADTFLAWLAANWTGTHPPTDFLSTGAQTNYADPHFSALILRAVLCMDKVKRPSGTGEMQSTYATLFTKCMNALQAVHNNSGAMAGSFSPDPTNEVYFGFWHGEILSTLAQLYLDRTRLGALGSSWSSTALDWLAAGVVWVKDNTGSTATGGGVYTPFPVEAEGFEFTGKGTLPRPIFRMSNVNGYISSAIAGLDDLIGARVVRKRTLAKYLDASNFANGNPDADPTQYWMDVYYIDRKAIETPTVIEFQLASALDLENVAVPKRQLIPTCPWRYRDPSTCEYAGTAYFDAQGNAVTSPAEDVCGKKLSDCRKRFGLQPLPFGGFPANA